jgi:FAD/FMN-containing dehydrogenase
MSKVTDEVFCSLKRQFRGELLRPSDRNYEQARAVWNGMVARTPGLIARCVDVGDVQSVLRAAVSAGALTAVRCGGHSLAGYSTCDGGLVIDLSLLREVTVEAEHRLARFTGGCLLGNLDAATQRYGLAFPSGVVSHTGTAGLVLGGGFGWLTRYGGLSCDNVEEFTMVTLSGSVVRANRRENEDLFWALRGGGGNFGVVTEFQVKLHPVTSVVLGEGFCVGHEIPRLLQRWGDHMPEAPERLKWNISLRLAPDIASIPAELRGRAVLSEAVLWVGDPDEGKKYVEQALGLAKHVGVCIRVMPFLELQTMADHEFPYGRRYYTKSGYLQILDHTSIERIMESLDTIPSPMTQIELAYLGGAAQNMSADETAFGPRSSPLVINILGHWSDPSEDRVHLEWVRKLFQALSPAMTQGVYTNFMSGDEESRNREAYGERWERLVSVKSKYDPENFLRLNQNIIPRKSRSNLIHPPQLV